MNKFSFGTKAETIKQLYEHRGMFGANVLKPYFFTVKDWNTCREEICSRIRSAFHGIDRLIVRSSARSEDSESESLAGKYESIICDNSDLPLIEAVDRVIVSYGAACADDQVLVQEAIEDVECSGVAFSREPNAGGYYYVINYDDKTGSTSSVTAGSGEHTKLFYWFSLDNEYPSTPYLGDVCKMIKKLVHFTGHDALDIEFLFAKGKLYILQARPLVLHGKKTDASRHSEVLCRIESMVRHQNRHKPFLFGKKTIYGVMPDWNPAEMIGVHPHNLATSLYKEIITDEVWAYQRDNYGYKRLRSFPLMVDFCGYPYIDVRVSFNSFIPADLDAGIAEKLVNYYLERLEENPDKHDKIEFDIVFSCYTFDLQKRIDVLEGYGFSKTEIRKIVDSLRNLTRKISDNEKGLWRADSAKLSILEDRREAIEKSDLRDVDKVFWLLEDCKRYGTLPFAGLARAGFIAVQLLHSMVSEGIISAEEKELFMNDLQTVGSSMKADYASMDKRDFLNKYGFLRPGTYDICSARYDETPDTYFEWTKSGYDAPKRQDSFRLSLSQMENIRNMLQEHGLGEDVLGLFSFIKAAIEGREQAKFIFTRNVSDILKYWGAWGARKGFSREDLSYADIRIIKDVYSGAVNEKEILCQSIEAGKATYAMGEGIVLPPLIANEFAVKSFFVPESQPNFVTQNRVQGELFKIDEHSTSSDMEGKILLIESADPGYDWIFSHAIKGFITKYGGANSHMAIRAGELGLTAVIGAGSRLYDSLLKAFAVEIDAPKKQVSILR